MDDSTYCEHCNHVIVGKPYWNLDDTELLCYNCMIDERKQLLEE